MAKRLASMTVGFLHEPLGHPRVQRFLDRVPSVYAAADSSTGFIDRSERNLDTFAHSWGPVQAPQCFGGEMDSKQMPSTLSL